MKKPTRFGVSRPSNRWRLQDAKARLSEVVRQAQQQGPQRVTVHGRDAVVVVRADEFDRIQRPVSGRDIVAALAASPLAEVTIERLTVKSPVRDVSLCGVGFSIPTSFPSFASRARILLWLRSSLRNLVRCFSPPKLHSAKSVSGSSNSKTQAVVRIFTSGSTAPCDRFFSGVSSRSRKTSSLAGKRWRSKDKSAAMPSGNQTCSLPIAALEDLVVVTRDTGEFVAAEVPVFDPWSSFLHTRGREVRIEPPASVDAVAELLRVG